MSDNLTFNGVLGSVIDSEARRRRVTRPTIADRIGLHYNQVALKLTDKSPIKASELVRMSAVLMDASGPGAPAEDVTPQALMKEAVRLYGGVEKLVSEVAGKSDDLAAKRATRQQRSAENGSEDIELDEKRAAIVDPELDTDE